MRRRVRESNSGSQTWEASITYHFKLNRVIYFGAFNTEVLLAVVYPHNVRPSAEGKANSTSADVQLNPLTPDSTKFKIDKFSKITNCIKLKNKQHHSKVLLNSFLMNDHT